MLLSARSASANSFCFSFIALGGCAFVWNSIVPIHSTELKAKLIECRFPLSSYRQNCFSFASIFCRKCSEMKWSPQFDPFDWRDFSTDKTPLTHDRTEPHTFDAAVVVYSLQFHFHSHFVFVRYAPTNQMCLPEIVNNGDDAIIRRVPPHIWFILGFMHLNLKLTFKAHASQSQIRNSVM